jgi:hypothetical protein
MSRLGSAISSEYVDGARSRLGIQQAVRIVPQTRDIQICCDAQRSSNLVA